MFASTPQTDAEPKSLGNLHADDFNSNQQLVPITYLAGRHLIAGQLFTPVYNHYTKPIKSQTGKDSTGTTGYTDYGTFGLVLCIGGRKPLEAIFRVFINAELVWENTSGVWFGSAESVDITIANYGTVRFYKGSWTQPSEPLLQPRGAISGGIDPRQPSTWPYRTLIGAETGYNDDAGNTFPSGEDNPVAGHYDTNPAFRPWAYALCINFKMGRNPSPIPTIQVEGQRSVPWFASTTVDRDAMALNATIDGVNLIGVAYDFATDPIIGLGRSDAELRQAGWEAALAKAAWLRASPRITNAMSVTEFFATIVSPWTGDVKSYLDGFMREYDGQLDIGVFDHGAIDLNALPLLVDDNLAGEPQVKPAGDDEIDTTFFLGYLDHDHYYQKQPQKYHDPNAVRRAGEVRAKDDTREWITSGAIAKRWVVEAGTIRTKIGYSGEVPVKREWLDNAPTVGGGTYGRVREGDRFMWSSASRGESIILWIVENEWAADNAPENTLHVENERGYWPTIYIPPADTSLGDFVIQPLDILTHRVLELPGGLKQEAGIQIAILALRPPRAPMLGFHVHMSTDAGATYARVSSNNSFAVFGKVKQANYNTTAALDTTTGMYVDVYGPDVDRLVSMTDQQRDDSTLLCFVDSEIMSVGQVVAIGSGRFRIYFRRGLYSTAIGSHNIDTNVWFIERDRLMEIANANFFSGSTVKFKLQGYTQPQDIDLAVVTAFNFSFATVSPSFPPPPDKLQLKSASPGLKATWGYIGGWDYIRAQDITAFEVNLTGPNYPEGSTRTFYMPPPGTTADLAASFVATLNGTYIAKVRAINAHGDIGAWSGTSGITFIASSGGGANAGIASYSSLTDLTAADTTNMNIGDLAFVTAADSTQIRQLQGGAPTGSDVSASTAGSIDSTKRWRKTGGF